MVSPLAQAMLKLNALYRALLAASSQACFRVVNRIRENQSGPGGPKSN